MSDLSTLTIEDLQKELVRRKAAEIGEIRRQIDEHKKVIRDLEERIRTSVEASSPARRGRGPAANTLPDGERADRVFSALESQGELSTSEIAAKVGFDGPSLKKTLEELLEEKKIKKTGKARGTKYSLA